MVGKRERELPDFALAVRRMIRALGCRFEREGDIEDLVEFRRAQEVLDAAALTAVEQLVRLGFSWSEIGRGFGMTGEGARKRWASKINAGSGAS